MRTLDQRKKQIDDDLVEKVDATGNRVVYRGESCVSADSAEQLLFVAGCALQARNLQRKTVAWIGGGFCIGPRLFDISNCTQTIYEIEPALAEFCPRNMTFIPGDYRATLTGTYDVIVYDLGGEVPRKELSAFLNSGGIILP
jgi:hypothetical protein